MNAGLAPPRVAGPVRRPGCFESRSRPTAALAPALRGFRASAADPDVAAGAAPRSAPQAAQLRSRLDLNSTPARETLRVSGSVRQPRVKRALHSRKRGTPDGRAQRSAGRRPGWPENGEEHVGDQSPGRDLYAHRPIMCSGSVVIDVLPAQYDSGRREHNRQLREDHRGRRRARWGSAGWGPPGRRPAGPRRRFPCIREPAPEVLSADVHP